ncbi:MAG: 23S rRNA (adenine(1618)-N(6))-methyltransferase RlmF [Ignavibacteria bacterium]|nr:23S rRNA (adenine(1618)-N(6))-methyltransferase RlmF [Ignavibacteria bacterium]
MLPKKRIHPPVKSNLHPRNRHRTRYNFKELIRSSPELGQYVRLNEYDDESIDFSNAEAVLVLNRALLKHFYKINYWEIPTDYLCPPIPGRADYLHYIADILALTNGGIVPTGSQIKCLDIGTGANCIYPIIGHREYGWSFIGSDIDQVALSSASEIIEKNSNLKGKIELRLQKNANDIFHGIIQQDERFTLTICNPPFHASFEEAQAGTLRKLSNLHQKRITKPTLNFGGQNNELWCAGGEENFIKIMINQSKDFAESCVWFSTLVAKQVHLKSIYKTLKKVGAIEVKTIPMNQGNKSTRIVAWTFLTKAQQETWMNKF